MAWQNTFTAVFGPGLFAGVTAGAWFRLLRENHFAVHPRYALRCLSITAASLANSLNRRLELLRYGSRFRQETIRPPLFVLGHWRSGTTHLHNLLSRDDRFAFPSLVQVLYPHTFLTTEAVATRLMARFMPETRFGMDNVKIGWDVPYEDEFAIATMSFLSPYLAMAFPRKQSYYDRYLTLRDASPEDVHQWKNTLTTFLQKLTWKYRRPLILKSPGHTCRIKLLLELFPDAKFVHIRRNPFHVFQSMQKMLAVTHRFWRLQSDDSLDWNARVIRQYREMYDVFFQEQRLIPTGHFYEVSFEALEADPVGKLREIYEALDLPTFDYLEPKLGTYVDALRGYRKNTFVELSVETRDRITREWQACFDAWDYSTDCTSSGNCP